LKSACSNRINLNGGKRRKVYFVLTFFSQAKKRIEGSQQERMPQEWELFQDERRFTPKKKQDYSIVGLIPRFREKEVENAFREYYNSQVLIPHINRTRISLAALALGQIGILLVNLKVDSRPILKGWSLQEWLAIEIGFISIGIFLFVVATFAWFYSDRIDLCGTGFILFNGLSRLLYWFLVSSNCEL
jgi:hypothetical protein